MSELGRLFRLGGAGPKPLENFTTNHLAVAIGHDNRPMKRALHAVDRSYHDPEWRLAFAKYHVAVTDMVEVTPSTQVTLWPFPADGRKLGFLDLVLKIQDSRQHLSEIWIEVKVDAWEGVDQIANYLRHAEKADPQPLVITLGRRRVSPSVPALRWSGVVTAIGSVSTPHQAWLDLRDFLLDERIVRPPVPLESIDAGLSIDVVVEINRRLRDGFCSGQGMAWPDGVLRKSLVKSFTIYHELVTTGGPLRYGLAPAGNGWEWVLAVTTDNYEHVRLDAEVMRNSADDNALPLDWQRYSDRPEVLERRAPLKTLGSRPQVLEWFEAGLEELHNAKVLDPYFVGRSKGHGHPPG